MSNFRHISNCTRSQRIQQFSENIMTAENLSHGMFPDVCLFKLGTVFPQKKKHLNLTLCFQGFHTFNSK